MRKKLQVLFLALCLHYLAGAQVVINEMQPANLSTIADEDGDFEDWIEVFNPTAASVNLLDWGLSDLEDEPFQWTFPSITLQPGERILVFASGKNRKNLVNHWEMAVDAGFIWRYFVGTSQPPENWNEVTFNATNWSLGAGGIGYGDDDDNTTIPNAMSVFMRYVFSVVDTSRIVSGIFCMDYDDGFVAYLNGTEIARNNVSGFPPFYETPADADHEANMYQGGLPDFYQVSTPLLKSLLKPGNNVLAVQTHNISLESSDLSSIPFLFFGISDQSVYFYSPPEWFETSSQNHHHANFKLNVAGETVFLTSPNGTIADTKSYEYVAADHSLLRFPDGSSNWCLTTEPSPDSINICPVCYQGYTPSPVFSQPSGFYQGTCTIQISSGLPGSVIHYTTNGNIPTTEDPVYNSPVTLTSTKVIKARSFGPTDYLPGVTAANTYILNDEISLPVVSISTDSSNLWDYYTGIYVMGPNASPDFPYFGANFWQDWEKESHIEYFSPLGDQGFEMDGFISIHGGWTRGLPQKSFNIKTSSRFYNSSIQYPLFEDKPISEFKSFMVRNAGNDWMNVHFRDALMQRALKESHVDYMAYCPSVVLLNGEYWGVYNIRERQNEDFIEENHGVDADSVDMIKFDGEAVAGTADAFQEMVNFIETHDLTNQENYEVVKQMWDIENYADYFIAETYYVNNDWIGAWTNNIELWRERKDGAKWRYIFWDLDFGLGLASSAWDDKLGEVLNPAVATPHSMIFNKMLQNDEFRHYFVNRYADLINTTFKPANLLNLAQQMREGIEDEMGRAWFRWFGYYNLQEWYNNLNNMNDFIMNRVYPAREHVNSHCSLNGMTSIYLSVNPPEAGRIKINTIIPDSPSWSGVYFKGNPIEITAIANPGFTFQNWSPNIYFPSGSASRSLNFDPLHDATFTANFTGSTQSPKLAISEINYHSDSTMNAGDWFEIYNFGAVPLDISDWHLGDSDFYHDFVIETGTIVQPGNYLVFVDDTAAFHSVHPGISVKGPLGFKLGNSGETIKISNYLKNPVVILTYTDSLPWPECADGWGRTLQIVDPGGDMNDPENWGCGCMFGSPGMPHEDCDNGIVFSEINYNSADWADAGDWVELFNSSDETVTLTGWKFSDNDDSHLFSLPAGVQLQPQEYLVLYSNLQKFNSRFPYVTNKTGPFEFGLSGDGEAIRLFKADGKLGFSMFYDDNLPWPPEPDGDGFTLELLDVNGDFCHGLNWFAGCPEGSPGEAYFEPCTTITPENYRKDEIDIFPNPARDLINIRFNFSGTESLHMKIINGLGHCVFEKICPCPISGNLLKVNTDKWSNGIYYLEVIGDIGLTCKSKRFVILH